jgi:hypothetical protein
VEHLKGFSIRLALALHANNIVGWKGLPGTNTLAYYELSQIRYVNGFITLGPGVNLIKLFTVVIYKLVFFSDLTFQAQSDVRE